MIAPGAVIGDVHALLALAGGFGKGAVHVELGLLEERGGLLLPQADPNVVEDVLKNIDVARRETSAKIACRRGIGNALRAERVEELSVVAA